MSKRWERSALLSATVAFGLAATSASAIAANQPVRFENFPWVIVSYFDGRSLVDPVTIASIVFVDGHIEGAGGCGAFSGEYFLSGAVVRIQAETILDDRPCFEVNLKEAQAILEALNAGERRIEQRADRMVLRDTSGAVQLVLSPGQ